jgi:hypothetical protein
MFFLLWAYIYYWIINIKEVKIKISENWLIVWEKIVVRSNLIGYCLEVEPKKEKIKNIVFVSQKGHSIYTISDKTENIRLFLKNLEQIIPIMPEFHQTFREKFSRRMKL